jgi:hypothetical protein
MENKDTIISNITKEIGKLENKEFSFFFFVIDTKGNPNGSVAYIYDTAMVLKEMGYNVKMLHGEKEFIGVQNWLGEEYASLPHFNIETDGVAISPSDFLIIPEIYSNVMFETFKKKIPCKRIALLNNFNYLTEIIQPGATWEEYGINECITSSESLSKRIKEVFPNISTQVVKHCVVDVFKGNTEAKKLMFNIVAENKSDVNKIVKEFFWKYPLYKWVGFRNVRGLSRSEFANALDEAVATIWVDTNTDFGYSAVEAMAAGNIVIGKIPEEAPDWMFDGENLKDNGVWFYNIHDVHEIIANVIQSFIHNNIPNTLYENAKETANEYNVANFRNDIKKVYIEHFVNKRISELNEALTVVKNNND